MSENPNTRIAEVLGLPYDLTEDLLGLTPDQRRQSDLAEFSEKLSAALRPHIEKLDRFVLGIDA